MATLDKHNLFKSATPRLGRTVSPADVVGHLVGDDHGNFHHAADLAVLTPWGLVDHLFDTLLVDGVAVDGVGGDHVADFLLRLLAMAGHEVLAQHGVALLVKSGS